MSNACFWLDQFLSIVPREPQQLKLAATLKMQCEGANAAYSIYWKEAGGRATVVARAPLAELLGYATALRSATAGEATFALEYAHHAPR